VGHNVGVRKLVIGVAAVLTAALVGGVGTDFGAAIYAEYRLARSVRSAADLGSDPSVAILGFPFIPQAMAHHYDEVEIKASGVDHPVVGRAALEATLHSVDIGDSWLVAPDATLSVDKLESRIIIDSTHLGRFLGITDLLVEAPTDQSDEETTESGISGPHGLVFTGTPDQAGLDEKVSVAVDLSVAGPDQSTVVFTATGVLTGPGTADQEVSDEQLPAVLKAFSAALPDQRLPFGVTPTHQGARGSDVIIEGITDDRTIELPGFRSS
jgi:hypothetical protein